MSIATLLRQNREESQMTREQLADKLGVPEYLVKYLEEPDADNDELEKILAEGLGITLKEFRGEVHRPTREELQDARATYAAFRTYIIAPERCVNPPDARELLGDAPLSMAEQNLLVYMATIALYTFCDVNYSSFSFDEYVFGKHAMLLERLEKSLASSGASAQEKEERMVAGRANVFACESIENIAVAILDSFAAELEEKLVQGDLQFEKDIGMPFTWYADRDMKRIEIRGPEGEVRDTLKLVDAARRTRSHGDT
jgi:transcriptional regulator with XRE-family HTH domain